MKIAALMLLLLSGYFSHAQYKWRPMDNTDTCLSIPNTISPNSEVGDGYFDISSSCSLDSFEMFIYNRWGEKVFECKDINKHWEGTKNGIGFPAGTYVYLIRYRRSHSKSTMERTGVVTLIR